MNPQFSLPLESAGAPQPRWSLIAALGLALFLAGLAAIELAVSAPPMRALVSLLATE
jgi:hypothetical protein